MNEHFTYWYIIVNNICLKNYILHGHDTYVKLLKQNDFDCVFFSLGVGFFMILQKVFEKLVTFQYGQESSGGFQSLKAVSKTSLLARLNFYGIRMNSKQKHISNSQDEDVA